MEVLGRMHKQNVVVLTQNPDQIFSQFMAPGGIYQEQWGTTFLWWYSAKDHVDLVTFFESDESILCRLLPVLMSRHIEPPGSTHQDPRDALWTEYQDQDEAIVLLNRMLCMVQSYGKVFSFLSDTSTTVTTTPIYT